MCGILGYISKSKNKFKSFDYKNSIKSLEHRGPDGYNYIKGKDYFFGHTRLSIVGPNEIEAKQPIYKNQKILIFNGEIYNFKELNKELNELKIFNSGNSDTETLFHCIENFGIEQTLSKIDGMYAFAFFDIKKNKLFLARDKIGEKPLYYSHNNDFFIFSSEIKSIILSNTKNYEPNYEIFHEIFLHGQIYGSETAFKNIFEVQPGFFLELNITLNSFKLYQYWKIEDFEINNNKILINEFEEKFNDCIKSRLISDFPISSLISGGIDSSSLAYKLLELSNQNDFNFFFAKNKNKEIDEYKQVQYFINFLKKKFNKKKINLHIVKTEIYDYWNNLEKTAYHNDEPCTFNNFQLVYNLTKEINKKKFKVVFSGEGSDEIFFGYERFINTSKKFEKNNHDQNLSNIYYGSSYKDLENISKIINSKNLEKKIYNSESWEYLEMISKKFDLNTVQMIFSQKYRMLGLLQRQDRAAMANGVESRAPFLKASFVKWINSININYKYNKKNNINKLILRKYMSKYLNSKIVLRKKIGFATDFDLEITKNLTLKKIKKIVQNENSFSSNYLNKKNLMKILDDNSSLEKNKNIIQSILKIESWFKSYYLNN